MDIRVHPLTPHDVPSFISGPTEGDPLYVLTTVMLLAAVIGLGVLFFTLHSLPERMGHKKLQFEIVAVLCLLSLFTHIHAFWVAGLLLALIDIPDFNTPMKRMAKALEKLAGIESPPERPSPPDAHSTAPTADTPPQAPHTAEPAIPNAVAATPAQGS